MADRANIHLTTSTGVRSIFSADAFGARIVDLFDGHAVVASTDNAYLYLTAFENQGSISFHDVDSAVGLISVDTVHQTDGIDHLSAVAGSDAAYLIGGHGDDQITGTDGADTLYGYEGHDRIEGFGGEDKLVGGTAADVLYGGDGDDHIYGNSGDDRLHGGAGDDYVRGGRGDDVLYGKDGDDVLRGSSGDDDLHGQDGDDVLVGGGGHDHIWGGAGNDRIAYTDVSESPASRYDTLKDFVSADEASFRGDMGDVVPDTDKIDLSKLAVTHGLSFIGIDVAFTGSAGEVLYQDGAGGEGDEFGFLKIDFDGDKVADFALKIETSFEIDARDLILS